MNAYLAISAHYEYTEIVDPELGGPSYDTQDCALIYATSKRKARAEAMKVFRKHGGSVGYNSDNPFFGIVIEDAYPGMEAEDWGKFTNKPSPNA